MKTYDFRKILNLEKRGDDISEIINEVLKSADPEEAVRKNVKLQGEQLEITGKKYGLAEYKRVFVIGAGKGAFLMAKALESLLGDFLVSGLIIYKQIPESMRYESNKITFLQSSHPVPDQRSVDSTHKLLEFCDQFTKDDLVLCVITGGGSSLLTAPAEGIDLDDLRKMTQVLFKCGAEISEINTLRKHLDIVKGGGLARRVHPAELLTLIISDVIGSPLEVIASGPTVADSTTYADSLKIVDKYQIRDELPEGILGRLESGVAGKIADTVKPGDICLEKAQNEIIADNFLAGCAAIERARNLGFNSLLLSTFLKGEASQAGLFFSALLQQIDQSGHPLQRPACIIAGGETTVNIHGEGLGGRNLELALGSVRELSGLKDVYLITLATDGEDGPTDAAGAVVRGETLGKGLLLGLNPDDYLRNNDSYHYFEGNECVLKIGSTGTNVNDMTFLFAL